MNPQELAERLSNAYRAVTELGYESELSTLDVLDAMREAADLLAKARVEWRGQMKGRARFNFHEDDLPSWQLLGARIESRHVIETPWVAEDGAPPRIG